MQRFMAQGNVSQQQAALFIQQLQQQAVNEAQQQQQQQQQQQRHSDPLGGLNNKEKLPNFADLAKTTPPFKDYLNNLHTYQYLQQLEHSEAMQPRHTQITQQYSSSTDEGCDTDHGGKLVELTLAFAIANKLTCDASAEMDETPTPTTMSSTIQRLNSYASSSSSSGVVTNFASKSLSQNLSCDSSRSNFSTFESLDLNLSDCSDLASSLPSCASGNVNDCENKDDGMEFLMSAATFFHYEKASPKARSLSCFTFITFSSFLSCSCLPTRDININHPSMRLRFDVRKDAVLVSAQQSDGPSHAEGHVSSSHTFAS